MPTITYSNHKAYVANRPYADVVLIHGATRGPTHVCLVDTGADFLELPTGAATAVGLSLASGTRVPVSTAAGTHVTMTKLTGVSVEVEGTRVTVDVLFNPHGRQLLLGRQALFAAFSDVGFQTTRWLRP
jgi:predicted aspartyl protease